MRLISSVVLARTREALHNGWDKNAPKDAQVTLHMIRIGASQVYQDPLVTGINDVQELSVAQARIEEPVRCRNAGRGIGTPGDYRIDDEFDDVEHPCRHARPDDA